jgi:hypothetical protein
VKNGMHFANEFIGRNKRSGKRHSLKLNQAKMMKKVACLAVYQISAFAFVHDVEHFRQRCIGSGPWLRMVVRLREKVFNFRVAAHHGDSAAYYNEITPFVRSRVQKSIGYAVLCKFMVLTVVKAVSSPDRLTVKAVRKTQDPSTDVLPPDRLPVKSARKPQDPSSDVLPPDRLPVKAARKPQELPVKAGRKPQDPSSDVLPPDRLPVKAARKPQDPSSDVLPPDVPVVRLAAELKNLFESVNSLFEKTLGVLTTSSQNLAEDARGSSAKRGLPIVKTKQKARVLSEKTAPAAKKKQKLDSVSTIVNEKVPYRPETDRCTFDEESDTDDPGFSFGRQEKEQDTDSVD